MIRKVKVEDLKIGVFVHDFNCGWNGGNLYIEPNFIKSEQIIEILKSWGIKEVYIDTERGSDINKPKTPQAESTKAVEIGQTRKVARPQVPLAKELHSARQVTQDAVKIMQRTNQRAMEGKPPDVGPTYELANRMKSSINRNKDALLLLTRIRKKDEYTLYHSISVSSLVLNICNYCQIIEHRALDLAVGALFHDIGKTLVPQDILNKPGKLTAEEYRAIQLHVEYSVNLLSEAKGLPLECYDIALHHHERFDGNGYPHGLKNGQISFGSQLTCISDVFDAITSERCYKSGMDTVLGLRKIYEESGIFFSKEITHDFIQCVGVYPVGTCVALVDGRCGVVVGSTEDMMRPIVQVFYDERKKERIKPFKVDLTKTEDEIATYLDPKKFGLNPGQLLRKFLLTES